LTILCYLAITACASGVFWALIIVSGHVGSGKGLYVAGLMWCPAVAAIATAYIRRLDFNTLGLRWGGARYAILSYVTPLAYAAIAYALIWLFGFGFFPDPGALAAIAQKLGWTVTSPIAFVPLYLLLIGTTQMISSLAHAFGGRDRLARAAHAAHGKSLRIYPRQLSCRRDMGGMAYAAFTVRRLQQRDALVVFNSVLLRTHDWA
jgi:hypothetical protein